jgi:hypothetical protein
MTEFAHATFTSIFSLVIPTYILTIFIFLYAWDSCSFSWNWSFVLVNRSCVEGWTKIVIYQIHRRNRRIFPDLFNSICHVIRSSLSGEAGQGKYPMGNLCDANSSFSSKSLGTNLLLETKSLIYKGLTVP